MLVQLENEYYPKIITVSENIIFLIESLYLERYIYIPTTYIPYGIVNTPFYINKLRFLWVKLDFVYYSSYSYVGYSWLQLYSNI